LALELLRGFDGPVAAPSANRSTHVSPTTAEHVREEMGNSVDLILDGGPCRVGIESTVLDLSGAIPTILRPGSITREQLEAEIGPVDVFEGAINPSLAAASPGQHAIHYAPRLPAYRFSPEDVAKVIAWLGSRDAFRVPVLLVSPILKEMAKIPGARVIQMPALPSSYAHDLYAVLRAADVPENEAILIEMPVGEPAWAAIRDRLIRATRPLADAL
jgi:L-threonylcarbamoyladenylate synthase